MPLRVRQLRTPSDFEEQAAATRLRRQTTLAEQARLRETTASQQGRARVHGSLAESFAAPAREAEQARQFETAKRQKIEEKWAREDKQRITQQGAESAFDLVQQEDRLRASGKSKLEIASTMQSLYDAEVERLGWTDRLPKPYNRSRMEMAIAQGQSMKEQIARQFELEKIRLQSELKSRAPREFAPQVETKYLPVGEDEYQLTSVNKVTGETKPVMREGKPVALSRDDVMVAEGKKTRSIVNDYEKALFKGLGKEKASQLSELEKTALEAYSIKAINQEGRRLLNEGIYTGSAANIKLAFDKWLQEVGVSVSGKKATNTDTFAAMMGLQVGKIIKQFGSGTGLSDADREYAEKIVGGRVTLTADAIEQLLDINDRLADFNIRMYKEQVQATEKALKLKQYLKPVESSEKPSFGQRFNELKKANPNATKEDLFVLLDEEGY